MIIRSGTAKKDVLELANDYLQSRFFKWLLRWDKTDFQGISGIGKVVTLHKLKSQNESFMVIETQIKFLMNLKRSGSFYT